MSSALHVIRSLHKDRITFDDFKGLLLHSEEGGAKRMAQVWHLAAPLLDTTYLPWLRSCPDVESPHRHAMHCACLDLLSLVGRRPAVPRIDTTDLPMQADRADPRKFAHTPDPTRSSATPIKEWVRRREAVRRRRDSTAARARLLGVFDQARQASGRDGAD